MNLFPQLDRTDKTIVSIASLCALCLFLWLAYDIANYNPNATGQTPIGVIAQAKNKVKRKTNNSLIWYEARDKDQVYLDDWIFTSDGSIAKIELDSGGTIVVEPGSLIILSKKNGQLQLDLKHGQLLADIKNASQPLNLIQNGKIQKLSSQSGRVRVAQNSQSNQVSVEPIKNSPKDASGNEKPLEELVEVKPQKQEEIIEELVEDNFFKPQPGFSGLNSAGLSLKKSDPVQVQLLEGRKTQFKAEWEDPQLLWKKYEVQVSQSEDFEKIVSQQKSDDSSIEVSVDKEGPYYWRVRGEDSEGQLSQWSESQTSEVNIDWMRVGPAVQLAKNKIFRQLKRSDKKNVLPDRSVKLDKKKNPLNIKWKPARHAKKYKVLVSDQPDFENILEEKVVTQPQLQLESVKLGKSYFKIIPETAQGDVIAQEAKGQIQTLLPPPNAKKMQTIGKKNYQVLKWEPLPHTSQYEVRYSQKANGPLDQVKKVEGTRLDLVNNPGQVRWKVRAVDSQSNQILSPFSKPINWAQAKRNLSSVSGKFKSLAPVITKPEKRKSFISVDGSPLFILVNWDYEKEARGYELEIAKTPDMKKRVLRKKGITKKRAVINKQLSPGTYYLRVRARHDNPAEERWSRPEVFQVFDRQSQAPTSSDDS